MRDKLQLLGAFAEEEPITSQCSAVPSSAVQCICSAFAEKEPVATEIQFLFFVCLFALYGVDYCLFASKLVLYFSTLIVSPLNIQSKLGGFYFFQ